MLLTVPTAPPEAGPDRAFVPPPAPPPAPPPGAPEADATGAGVADEDEARPTEAPTTEKVSAAPAAAIHRRFLLDSRRRTPGWVVRSAIGSAAELDVCGPGGVSWGLVGSSFFMVALL
jgi:hypothetical protein